MNFIPEIVRIAKNLNESNSPKNKAAARLAAVIVNLSESNVKPDVVDNYIQENLAVAKNNLKKLGTLKADKLTFESKIEESINYLVFKQKTVANLKEWHEHYSNVKSHLTSFFDDLEQSSRKIDESAKQMTAYQKLILETTLRSGLEEAYKVAKKQMLTQLDEALSKIGEDDSRLNEKCTLLEYKIKMLTETHENLEEGLGELDQAYDAIKDFE